VWNSVLKDFLPNHVRPRLRLAAWLYEVHYNLAIVRPQHAGRNFDNPREGGRIANCPDALSMPHICCEILRSPKRACQTLALLRTKLVVESLLVQRAVAVITSVEVQKVHA
jgi:hypothetical protein